MRTILDTKYEKEDLHKVMETQSQYLTMTQLNDLLKLLQKFEEFSNETLVTRKTDPVEFKLKEDTNPIRLRPYPLSKVQDKFFKK